LGRFGILPFTGNLEGKQKEIYRLKAIRNIKEFATQINKEIFLEIAFIYGEENYYLDKTIELIQQISKKLNYSFEIIDPQEKSVHEILDLASEFSLFGGKRIIVVKDFGSVKQKEKLNPYFDNPSSETSLILIENSKVNLEQNQTYRKLVDLDCVYESPRLKENEILDWIETRFKKQKIKVDFEIVNLLYLNVGNNLAELDAELSKIFLALGDEQKSSKESIEKLIVASRRYSIFDLYNSLRDKKFDSALKIGYNLLNGEATVVYIIVMLQRYFNSLLTFSELKRISKTQKELAAKISCHPYYLKDYEKASKLYTFNELSKIFEILLQKDIQLKSTRVDEKTLFTMMIGEIAAACNR
jgi:DNA polymerase-3 subunit delta